MIQQVTDANSMLLSGLSILASGYGIAHKQSKITIISSTLFSGFLVTCIKLATNQIFNQFNWQPGSLRSFTEWSFSIISAALLATSATVGLELASSKEAALLAAVAGIALTCGSVLVLAAGVNICDIIVTFRRRGSQPNPVPLPLAQVFPPASLQAIRNAQRNRLRTPVQLRQSQLQQIPAQTPQPSLQQTPVTVI